MYENFEGRGHTGELETDRNRACHLKGKHTNIL
jgi:hypothetical protein